MGLRRGVREVNGPRGIAESDPPGSVNRSDSGVIPLRPHGQLPPARFVCSLNRLNESFWLYQNPREREHYQTTHQ